jgi:protein-S-isoprenylcysteine O-methyltransferase Ste14
MAQPPGRLVTSGPYALTRNPMYLGHLIFVLGLALAFRSKLAAALGVGHALRFWRRVHSDEERLQVLYGDEYRAYKMRVKRWIPGLI